MKPGDWSPWGLIQHVETLTPGIWFVSTASHGGIKLDDTHNAKMPDYVRRQDGWYEEDCEWSLVALVFSDIPEFDECQECARECVQYWYPKEYKRLMS